MLSTSDYEVGSGSLKKLGDPFDGFFLNGNSTDPEKDSLLDLSAVRRWFDVVGWGSRNDLYTYQQALESKSGPRVVIGGQDFSMISSYDYLGLIGHPEIEEAAVKAIMDYGTSTGGVRLLVGTTALHRDLEKKIAQFKGTESAITFSSGYMSNIGIISSLLGPNDIVVIDSKAHKSIVEGCHLARVQMLRFVHNNPESLEEVLKKRPEGRRTLIVVEGVYSMDGDICPLPQIIDLKKQYGAYLMVDEAHSLGVLGSTGRGVGEYFGTDPLDVDIWVGSLAKAIPAGGGYIAAKHDMIIYLQHGAAPFMFSAALCPASAAAALQSFKVLEKEPERLKRLRDNSDYLRYHLKELGYDTGTSCSPVIPVIAGEDETAYRFCRILFGMGIIAAAIVKPAVPPHSARLRLCATAAQDCEFLNEIIEGFKRAKSSEYLRQIPS